MKTEKLILKLLIFIVFIDMLGISMVFPIFTPMLLQINSIFGLASNSMIYVILGLLFASYSIAQFFGAPILGELSDKWGRKPLLILSLFGTFFGNILSIIAILMGNIYLLFFARILDGFTGGNLSIVRSIISDVTNSKNKAKNFGLIGMSFGLSFIFGPLIGGVLSNSNIISWFSYTIPFIFAGFLTLINIILVFKTLPETVKKKNSTQKITAFSSMKILKDVMYLPIIGNLLIVTFFWIFGFSFFTQFFQVYLFKKFNYGPTQIGLLFAYMGIWIAFVQGFLIKKINNIIKSHELLKYTLFIVPIVLLLILTPTIHWVIFLILPFMAIPNGLSRPNLIGLLSNITDKNEQGKIMGVSQSIESLAMALPPIIAGFLTTLWISLPIITAASLMFIAWIIYMKFYFKNKIYLDNLD